MKELGFIPHPEQYASAADLLLTENSVEAQDFFEEYFGNDGVVFLCNILFNSLKHPVLPFWAYVSLSNKAIISLLPIVKLDTLDDYAEVFNASKFRFIPIMSEAFFRWKNNVLSSVFTSTGEIVIKKILSLLEQSDVEAFVQMDYDCDITDIYPVNLYSVPQNQFICACWAIEMDDIDTLLYQPICFADVERAKQFEGYAYQDYPIDVGDTVLLGEEYYTLCCDEDNEFYFQRNAVQTKLSIHQVQPETEQIVPPPEPVKKTTPIFTMPQARQVKPQQKKAAGGQCVYMNINGTKNDEPMASAKTQPHIIPFKPKK